MSRFALLILFFASGTSALIYELVWFHLVSLVVGASSLSIAALLASFMGGMAIGSALLPRIVSVKAHPLRVLAGLELGIGIIGAVIPLLLPYLQAGYLTVVGYGYSGVLLRAAVCAVALLPPTILMGATLPAISRWTAATPAGASTVGMLYMANIGGGAFGTMVAGFYLLRVHDTMVATAVAVATNALGAAFAWWLSGRYPYTPFSGVGDQPASKTVRTRVRTAAYGVAAVSGLTALGAEVVWTRQLSLLFGASVYTFSLILAVFLSGLGLGSLLGSSLARRARTPAVALAWCQLALVLAIAYGSRAIVDLLPAWQPTRSFLPQLRSSPELRFAFDALRTAVALLPATLLWGASFPLALATATGGHDAGRPVARLNAINTLGSLAGAVVFTLLAVPNLGSQRAQQMLVFLAALMPALLFWLTSPVTRRRVALAACTLVALAAAFWIVPPVPARLIAYGRSVDSWASIKQFLYLEEGATASVAVTEGIAGARQFHISGKVEASDMDIDMRLERMLGHIPALVHPAPKTVLIVGVGAGVTAGTFVVHPEVERIVICEIEPVVPASARAYFGEANHHVFDDPRVDVVFDDARHFLQTTPETFDIITSDPIHPWVRGAATLYSLEYLELARNHLKPGGVFTQWVPLYETDETSVKTELATFVQAFPESTFWSPDLLEEGYDLVAMGRVTGDPINEAVIARRLEESPEVRESLSHVALQSARALMATYAGRGRDLAPWLVGAEINRERHLRLQYLAGMAANADQPFAIFQAILRYRRYPTDLFAASAETERWLRRWYVP